MTDWPTTGPTYVTALPSGPYDGQEIFFAADATNGVIWHLRYRAASASAYKWEFLGGPALVSESVANLSTASTTYVTAMTGGNMPSLVLPALAGDWDIEVFAQEAFQSGVGYGRMSYKIGATSASDVDSIVINSGSAPIISLAGQRRKTAIAASTTLQSQARVTTGTFFPNNANNAPFGLRATPVRVG